VRCVAVRTVRHAITSPALVRVLPAGTAPTVIKSVPRGSTASIAVSAVSVVISVPPVTLWMAAATRLHWYVYSVSQT